MLADTSTVTALSNVLPQIAIVAAVAAVLGWSLRGMMTKKPVQKAANPGPQARDRAKNLEAALEKSKDAHKSLKSDYEALKSTAVATRDYENAQAELAAARKSSDGESKRIAALETDLKKAQDTIKTLNGRTNEADKAQKDRRFALENELSKARQELAILQAKPDNTSELQIEIERLRESVATTTRYAGEVRKRETAALEALEKAQNQLAESGSAQPASNASRKIGPVGDSDRVAAAKAEVLRLIESNKQAAQVASSSTTPEVVSTPVVEEVKLDVVETPVGSITTLPIVEEKTAAIQEGVLVE
jgi:DNA repair exonuclease SbcCD ATPase subunit